MSERLNKKALYISGGLHLAFFLLMGLLVLVKLFSKPPEEDAFVFEMVEAPSDTSAAPAVNQPLEPTAIVTPEVPEFEVRDRHAIEMPEIPVLPEAPVLPAEPVAPVKKEPVAKPKPKPTVQPMTLEQFRQQHGKPQPRTQPRQTMQRNVDVPDVAVPTFNSSNQRDSSPRRNASSKVLDAAYKAKLKRNANLAWDRPKITNTRFLEAKILYTIAPNGTIESVQFEERSGNTVLDNSAIAAARKTRSPGPTPSGKREIIRIRFVIE